MTVLEILTRAFAALAAVGLGSAALAGVAFWFFRKFGEKWLDTKFSQRLQDYKHTQQRELEKLRFSINALMDRTTKLHQFEFDVLPEVWARLIDSFNQAVDFVSPLQQYPDVDRMHPPHLAEFLSNCELAEWQKEELAVGPDKTTRYSKMIFWHRLHRVHASYAAFHNYHSKNGIFIQAELNKRLDTLSILIGAAIFEKKIDEENPVPRPDRFANGDRLRKEGPEMLKAIETTVKTRLWNARSLD